MYKLLKAFSTRACERGQVSYMKKLCQDGNVYKNMEN